MPLSARQPTDTDQLKFKFLYAPKNVHFRLQIFMRFTIVNAIHWYARVLKICKGHGRPQVQCVQATGTRMATSTKCVVCVNIGPEFVCCTKAVVRFTKRIEHSVVMHVRRHAPNHDVISKSIPFVWPTIGHFWIHSKRFARANGPFMNGWAALVIHPHNEAVNWPIGCSNHCDRHRAMNILDSWFVAAICERIDRNIIWNVRDDTIQVSDTRWCDEGKAI